MEDNPLPLFLDNYQSKRTAKLYRSILLGYLVSAYGRKDPTLAAQYVAEVKGGQRKPEEDIIHFVTVYNKGKAPKTHSVRMAVIKEFLAENGIEFSIKFWKKARLGWKGSRALTLDQPPTVDELRKILIHIKLPYKAAFLMLLSSGMRIGELMSIRLLDIDLGRSPPTIKIRGAYTKTGNSRVTFITKEAKEALEEWLKIRDKYLVAAVRRGGRHKAVQEQIFPLLHAAFFQAWSRALNKAQLGERDSQTRIYLRHIHTLRKFFRTQLGSVSNIVPPDVTEALLGHEAVLNRVYARYSVDQLAEFYRQGEHMLTVFGDATEMAKMKKQVNEGQRELERLVVEQASRIGKMEMAIEDLTTIVKATKIEPK